MRDNGVGMICGGRPGRDWLLDWLDVAPVPHQRPPAAVSLDDVRSPLSAHADDGAQRIPPLGERVLEAHALAVRQRRPAGDVPDFLVFFTQRRQAAPHRTPEEELRGGFRAVCPRCITLMQEGPAECCLASRLPEQGLHLLYR